MPMSPLSRDKAQEAIDAVEVALVAGHPPPGVNMGGGVTGAIQVAARSLDIAGGTFRERLRRALSLYNMQPDWSLYRPAPKARHTQRIVLDDVRPILSESVDYHELIRVELSHGSVEPDVLAQKIGLPTSLVKAVIADLHHKGFAVSKIGETFSIPNTQPPAYIHGPALEIESDKDGRYRLGVISDTHLGSKYSRLDVLEMEYDRFAKNGCTHVLHAGNWIDGEASFNKHDLLVHGMDAQIRYMAEHYPVRKGIHTYAVAGDDHEGWYSQREGVDIGRYAESVMRDCGRSDWHDMGYMESHVKLIHKKTGQTAVLALVHPGGGSAYAESYSIQKIIESIDGGTKPSVAIYGHYHKMLAGEYRNVWWLQAGCTQDQTPFARKKKLRFVLGGTLLTLGQDPETGAIESFLPDMKRYFNYGYYQNRWSHSGPIALPEVR